MMWKNAMLLFCYLFVSLSCSPMYPSFRFGQRDTSIVLTSSIEDPVRLLEEDGAPSTSVELRSGRHADAVFTNRYRKVLGQISARRFLQTIMGKRLQNESVDFVKRHQLGIFKRTYEEGHTTFHRRAYRAVQQKVTNATKPASNTHSNTCINLFLLL
ncbi:somatoliberin [Gadus morhua]|uniref:somatoliberin n=1 Tax=Gadus morhua TaxID=8049 RepID=UPI0011B7BE76|nr:VIP peptides-like [Gadus morhua]